MYIRFWSQNLKGRAFGRPKRRWEDNIRMDRREIGWKCVEWMNLVHDGDSGGLL
jgi:hypothetical protein